MRVSTGDGDPEVAVVQLTRTEAREAALAVGAAVAVRPVAGAALVSVS